MVAKLYISKKELLAWYFSTDLDLTKSIEVGLPEHIFKNCLFEKSDVPTDLVTLPMAENNHGYRKNMVSLINDAKKLGDLTFNYTLELQK